MDNSRKLVILGDSAFAEVAYECFTHDSEYEVSGFAVEREYRSKSELFGLPVVDIESMEDHFPVTEHCVYAALVYTKLNRVRERLVGVAKNKGYPLASYVSSRAFVWPNVEMGEHCFIFEDNTVQPFVRLGDNVVLWSGNHIGHHSRIGQHVFISSHVVVSGFVEVGDYCFLGVNSTISNNVSVARDSWIGPGVVITRDTDAGSFYKPTQCDPAKITTYRYFKIRE